MKLTICLVTKGRHLFLGEALKSYEPFLDTGSVNVILVDNGSDDESKKLLVDWKNRYPHLVNYVRVNKNEPASASFFWEKIKSFGPEWIIFPGDDDLLVFAVFESFMDALKNTPEISAYASSAEFINVSGVSTGLIRQPAIHGLSSKSEQLSKSLHEPPFSWPGLFFRFDLIKEKVPNSRFVADWWIGLQLILAGKIMTTSSIGVKYRVHNLQESNQTPSRRKYFEGFHMLIEMINSRNFLNRLNSMPSTEVIKFLELSFVEKPLYSQSQYYIPILKDLTFNALNLIESSELRNEVLEKYLLAANILSKEDDLNNFYINSNWNLVESKGNVEINFAHNACSELNKSLTSFNRNSTNKYTVACKHSAHPAGSIIVNCAELVGLSIAEAADSILLAINNHLERTGYLVFSTTPFEKSIIDRIRQVKSKIPKIVMRNSTSIKRLMGN